LTVEAAVRHDQIGESGVSDDCETRALLVEDGVDVLITKGGSVCLKISGRDITDCDVTLLECRDVE
jgi:hypothetical protein